MCYNTTQGDVPGQRDGVFRELERKRAKMSGVWCFLVPNSTDFADKMGGYGPGDAGRTNGICDF